MRTSVKAAVKRMAVRENDAYVNAVWYLTAKCNYVCPYCINESIKKTYADCAFPDAKIWAAAWNRIEEELVINLTGGEPFLWKGLIDFVYLLEEDKRVAISTNGSLNLLEFVQKVPPQKCIKITMSYHPSQQVDLHYFMGKVLMLKNRGFNVNVNFVAYPEQIWIIPELLKKLGEYDISMNVDPYLQNPGIFYYSFNEAELEFLKKQLTDKQKFFFKRKKINYRCNAGSRYFVVLPNGDVYCCLTKAFSEPPLGNLLDKGFQLRNGPASCETVCAFSTDREYFLQTTVRRRCQF